MAPTGSGSAALRMSGRERVGGQRIVLRATQDSWVQVRSPQGLVLSRLMRRGEVLEIPGQRDLELMTGNAGGQSFSNLLRLIFSPGPFGCQKKTGVKGYINYERNIVIKCPCLRWSIIFLR